MSDLENRDPMIVESLGPPEWTDGSFMGKNRVEAAGQLSLYETLGFLPPEYIKDRDCTVFTPVIHGLQADPIYGKEVCITPKVCGRTDSRHFREKFLGHLFPLEEYDLIIVLFSGGKDSLAAYLHLLELGVPKSKIQLWHHDIDGGHPSRRMDWRCTQNYCSSFAEAENVPYLVSYRKNGFFGELYRIGTSEACYWVDPDTGEPIQCRTSKKYQECERIKELALPDMEKELARYGYRWKFPAKRGDLATRWCSAYLKIMVADSVITSLDKMERIEQQLEDAGGKRQKFPARGTPHSGRWCSGALKAQVQDCVTSNLESTKSDKKILVVSGERRGESGSVTVNGATGRAGYNEMEIHRTNANSPQGRTHRTVHAWRCVIDWSEKDIWEIIKRHRVQPHPCYRAGWNRCSCAQCIFSTPRHFAGIKELYPDEYASLKKDEEILGFTLDNKCSLDEFVGQAKSCVFHGDTQAIHSLLTGEYTIDDVYIKRGKEWRYPAGAFHGAEGGPC